MKSLSLALLLAVGLQTPDTGTFSDPYIGLTFTHSKSWAPLKKKKDVTRYYIPIEGSPENAELEIIRSNYHSTKDIWRTIQLDANASMKRNVTRQWEQDVINVPLLCTQIDYTEKGTAMTTLTGLYYTKTPIKMLVRLTAPASSFEAVRYEFIKDLESLRTIDGSTPHEDDPDFKFENNAKAQLAPPKPKLIDTPPEPKAKTFKNETSLPLVVSTKSVLLHFPGTWTSAEVKDGDLTLTTPKLSGAIKIEVHSSLDSDRPSIALNKATSAELALFLPGLLREDTDPTVNPTGCSVSTVWRTGKDSKGPLATFDASGEQGDFYFLASYRVTAQKEFRQARALVRQLMDEISLSPGS